MILFWIIVLLTIWSAEICADRTLRLRMVAHKQKLSKKAIYVTDTRGRITVTPSAFLTVDISEDEQSLVIYSQNAYFRLVRDGATIYPKDAGSGSGLMDADQPKILHIRPNDMIIGGVSAPNPNSPPPKPPSISASELAQSGPLLGKLVSKNSSIDAAFILVIENMVLTERERPPVAHKPPVRPSKKGTSPPSGPALKEQKDQQAKESHNLWLTNLQKLYVNGDAQTLDSEYINDPALVAVRTRVDGMPVMAKVSKGKKGCCKVKYEGGTKILHIRNKKVINRRLHKKFIFGASDANSKTIEFAAKSHDRLIVFVPHSIGECTIPKDYLVNAISSDSILDKLGRILARDTACQAILISWTVSE